MTEATQLALLGSITSLFIAITGWITTHIANKQRKHLENLESKNEEFKSELRVRDGIENAACQWLGKKLGRTPVSIKIQLRNKADKKFGIRPKLTPRDFAD